MLALATADRVDYVSNLDNAAGFLGSLQQPSGEIVEFTGAPANAMGSVESHGEAAEAFADVIAGADRWVLPTGNDTGDCSIQASPCQTIAYAISQSAAGNTIHIAAGTYAQLPASNLTITAALNGLHLVGESASSKPVITRQAGGINQPLLVINGAKNVRVENLDFGMDQSFVAEGILASGFVDGLTIVNNHFGSSKSRGSQFFFRISQCDFDQRCRQFAGTGTHQRFFGVHRRQRR